METRLEVELPDSLIEKMKDTLDLEMEFLKGTKTKLDNGYYKCVIFIPDYKMPIVKDFLNALISMTSKEIKVSVMGIELNKN